MKVQLYTFKTNHTIMAEEVSSTDDVVVVKCPVQVVTQPTKDGPAIAFAPFLEFSTEFKVGISLPKADLLCVTTPLRELENKYNEIFGSGIQLVSSLQPPMNR